MIPICAFKGQNAFLSNFYPSPMVFQGRTYATVEHAFQAFKMVTNEAHEQVRRATTAGRAKRIARAAERRADWDIIKNDVMLICLKEKFFKNEKLGLMLLSTGDSELIEGNTWDDTYWGVCKGVGLNNLGKLLMQVRQELRDAQAHR